MAFRSGVIGLLLLTCATRALAAPSSAERETARSLMVEGDRLRNRGDHTGALGCYQSAHALMHVPTTGLALAETHAQLGHLVEARSVAMEVMNLSVTEGEPEVFVHARKSAAALATALEPRVPTLKTTVTPATAPYSVQIDDVVLPKPARTVPFKTNPGAHTVRIEAPGYQSQARQVELREGAVETLSFTLLAEPSQPRSEAANSTPPTAAVVQPSDDPGAAGRTRAIIGLSVGGLALAAGVVTGTLSWVATQDEKRHCAADGLCETSRASALARANTLANVANVTVPLGVIGIVYGLYELLTLPAAPPTQAALKFTVTAQGAVLRGEL